MLGFHHSVAVLPLPFRRSAVVKFRCSVKIALRKFRSLTAVNSKKIRDGNGETGTEERQRNGGNWKPVITFWTTHIVNKSMS